MYSRTNSSKRQPLSPFIRNKKDYRKSFPTTHMFFEALPKIFFASKFFSYRRLSSVEFPLSSFLSVPDEKNHIYMTRIVLAAYTRTFWFGSLRDLLSRWTSPGTASGSVWNGSINSRVARGLSIWYWYVSTRNRSRVNEAKI